MPSEDEERENTEATMDYMFPVALASALYARATGTAARHLREDIATILSTYTAKGGFADQREAREYMAGYIEPKDRAVLTEAARRLDEPWRTQELTRLSSAAYNWRITRKEAVDRAQRLAAKRLQQSAEEAVRRAAGKTVQAASRRTAYSVSREVGVAIRWDMPNERAIEQVVRGTGVYDLVKLYSVEQMKGVREIVTAGMLSGRRPEDIARDVSGYTATERWKSRRLVRTTIAQAAVDAEERELRELGIEEYEVACTLDERLCPICRRYDGKRYRFDDPKAVRPTFHPNCRCRIRQVIPQQYRAALRRSARDSEGRTATVPYDMGYDTWERIYGTERKQERLAMVDPPMRS